MATPKRALALNEITGEIIGAAMEVHSALGPGLLESAYRICLVHELRKRGFEVGTEVPLPVEYKEVKLDAGYRMDLVVEGLVIVELKSVDKLVPLFTAQLLSYLKLSNKKVGLLINFNVLSLKDGIRRVMNGFPETE